MVTWLLYRGEKFNANFFCQSGADIDHSFLIAGKSRRVLLTPEMNREYAESKFNGDVLTYARSPLKELSGLLKKSETVGLDFRSLPASLYLKLSKSFRVKDISEELAESRSIKGKKELKLMKKAASISKKIIESAGKRPKPTEKGTADQLRVSTYSAGAEPAFKPIVSSGPRTSYPHSTPTGKKISSPLMIDYGARVESYNSDITRCFRLSKEQEKTYSKLKRISKSIMDRLPNLETGADLAKCARELYKKEGLEHPPHSIGHGIGLEVHEKPYLSLKSRDSLAGATFTLEPSVYFNGKYGLRHENAIHFDGNKARVL